MTEAKIPTKNTGSLFKPRSFIRYGVVALLLVWYAFFLLHPINFIKADLGRHIKNGEIITSNIAQMGLQAFNEPIFNSNFYSFAAPNFPFVNHHWGSGVVFYILTYLGGFTLLQIVFVVISLITFLLFYDLAEKKAGFVIAAPIAFFLIPLIAERTEVRPEGFSYLLAAIFYYLLWKNRQSDRGTRWLYLLPVLSLIWINLHIYFVFGFLLLTVFLLEEFWKKEKNKQKIKSLLSAIGLSLLASLVNPFGLKGLLYPLGIFNNYGYKVIENQSVRQLQAMIPNHINARIFLITLFIFWIFLVALLAYRRKRLPLVVLLLSVFFGALAFLVVRNITWFALFTLPHLAIIANGLRPDNTNSLFNKKKFKIITIILIILFTIFLNRHRVIVAKLRLGTGLYAGRDEATLFIRDNNIKGPLFNDFDIGSFAIYYLYPKLEPFVDNRPEAYPTAFFQETYIPLHINEEVWNKKLAEYKFNIILYSFEDKAPWALPFIVKRLQDRDWAPVFANQFAIVFVRRLPENEEFVAKHEMDKSRFLLESD